MRFAKSPLISKSSISSMIAHRQGILVAASQTDLRERVAQALESAGFNVFRCADMSQAEQALHGAWVDSVVAELPAGEAAVGDAPQSLRDALRQCERRQIQQALIRCRGNKARGARIMGIGLSSLYRKLDEYGLESHVRS